MKRFTIMLAALLSAMTLFAQGKTVNESLKLRQFNSVDISHVWNVQVRYGSRQSVTLSYSEELKPYIIAEVKNGELELSFDGDALNRKLRNRMNHVGYNNGEGTYIMEAVITSPDLESIEASGAVNITCDGKFSADEFSVDLSGAANMSDLQVAASRLNLEVSGAGKLHVPFVEATDCDLDFSGAASVTIDGNIRNVKTDFSGACNVTMTGKYGHFNLDASGAGDIKLKGTSETLAVDASGACNIRARELNCSDAFVSGSGASIISVNPSNSISIDISGATSLSYPKAVSAKIISVSRGCDMDTF